MEEPEEGRFSAGFVVVVVLVEETDSVGIAASTLPEDVESSNSPPRGTIKTGIRERSDPETDPEDELDPFLYPFLTSVERPPYEKVTADENDDTETPKSKAAAKNMHRFEKFVVLVHRFIVSVCL